MLNVVLAVDQRSVDGCRAMLASLKPHVERTAGLLSAAMVGRDVDIDALIASRVDGSYVVLEPSDTCLSLVTALVERSPGIEIEYVAGWPVLRVAT